MESEKEEEIPDPDGADEATEELDELLPTHQPIDAEPVDKPKQEIKKDEWNTDILAESLSTMNNFSIRGVTGMTISNTNGVERYSLDPNMSYETNMVHFDVGDKGATIYGEEMQLQPKMTTPPEITKEIEKQPDIKFTDSDEDAFKK